MTWSGKNQALSTSLSQGEVEAMLAGADARYSVKRIPKDGMLFWSSEPHEYTYFLAEGMVELYTLDKEGRKKSIDFYGPGSFVGFQILRDTYMTMTTARACTDCRVIVVPVESFYKTLHACPEFADAVVKYLFGLLSMQTQEVINSSFYTALQRVPLLLLELADDAVGDSDPGGPQHVLLPYGNSEIADMLGVSRNSVTAALSRLRSQGVIETGRNSIRIVDRDKLEAVARLEMG